MKKLLLLSAILLAIASCTKEKPQDLAQYDNMLETLSDASPEGFLVNLATGAPILKGYAFDIGQNEQSNMATAVNQATGQEGIVCGWKNTNEEMVYRSSKVIVDYDEAILFARANKIDVMYDIANKTPIYTYSESEAPMAAGQPITDGKVSIEKKDKYYMVTIDFRDGNYKEIGKSYSRCVKKTGLWYLLRVKTYVSGSIWSEWIKGADSRMKDIKSTLSPEYKELIDGFWSQLPYCLIIDRERMMYLANLLPDVLRPTACSAYGVMPAMSESGQTLVHRNLDWPDYPYMFTSKDKGIVSPMQSVTKMIFKDKVIYSFGLLGLFNAITAIDATNGNMVGILDAGIHGTYSSSGKRSYVFDLMSALRTYNTTDAIAAEMIKTGTSYAFNHQILLADKDQVRVIENNMVGTGTNKRAVRSWNSELADHVTPKWDIDQTIGVVNSFMLKGQINNFNDVNGKELNSLRWQQQINKTKEILQKKTVKKLSMQDVREIECYYTGNLDGDWYKNLYNSFTFQMIEYTPATNAVSVFFKPFDASVPTKPTEAFIDMTLDRQ